MSHIPSAAMPHAKPHDPEAATPAASTRPAKRFPWLAIVAGGAVAIGTAVSAVIALRPAKPKSPRSTTSKRRRKTRND